MPVKQGDLELLQDPVSQELLQSKIPARLAYIATDGTPRVVPIWFHWNGREFVMATPPKAPKLKALAKNPKVALTIDDNAFPHKVRRRPNATSVESKAERGCSTYGR
jgi:nitroimidazol reductase NimA-like FMN-containing flavoprotein (pyridoxamine 5'-phosphate oxidase superfamily)